MKKSKAVLLILLSAVLCNNSAFSQNNQLKPNPDELKYKLNNGKEIVIKRKNYNFCSLIHPEMLFKAKYKKSNNLLLPLMVQKNYALLIEIEKIESGIKNFSSFFNTDILDENKSKDRKTPVWHLNTLFHIPHNNLSMTNAVDVYIISGFNPKMQPQRLYCLRGYMLNSDKNKVLKITGNIIIDPESPLYNNFDEVKKYLYDIKTYILTTRFE